mmetsp:Transcript_25972/g.54854  ORF Transcript_25972/g.54854 Transcript_25972/m.54854 type:complete len:82 (-) Transcript_25972:819-1064(-)
MLSRRGVRRSTERDNYDDALQKQSVFNFDSTLAKMRKKAKEETRDTWSSTADLDYNWDVVNRKNVLKTIIAMIGNAFWRCY